MRFLSLAIPVAHCALGALAWGAVGHEVVATIAQMHLHPTVLPALCDILNFTSTNPREPQCHLAPIATWADKLRYKMRWSAGLHYVGALDDYPSKTCTFPGPRGWAGKENGNVLGAIRNDTTLLQTWVDGQQLGQGATEEEHATANEALKFLVHFLGDMHMPLHLTGRDRGGNSVTVMFGARKTNLHSLWDNFLIAQTLRTLPSNYSRPLPFPQIEYNLRGTVYDGYIRRIMWQGLLTKWKEDIPSWLECPSTSEVTYGSSPWQQILRVFTGSRLGNTDDDVLCPYAWAKPIHQLNCDLIWPAALDEPPYKHIVPHAVNPEPPHYLQLDTPEYSGAIHRDWVIEKLLTQGGIRLAATLNWLFAVEEGEGLQRQARPWSPVTGTWL